MHYDNQAFSTANELRQSATTQHGIFPMLSSWQRRLAGNTIQSIAVSSYSWQSKQY